MSVRYPVPRGAQPQAGPPRTWNIPLTTSADVTVALTGVAGVGAVGTVIPANSVPVAQVAGIGAVGSVAPNAALAFTQVSGTGSVGAVAPAVSAGLTQTAATGSVGTLAPSTDVALTQTAATGSVGTVTVEQAGTVALTGVSATGSVGTVAPQRTVAITGNTATGSVGTVAATSAIALTGNAATGSAGSVSPNLTVALTGVSATGSVGSVAVASPDVTVALTGVQATGSVGSVSASGGDAVATGSLGFEMGGDDPKPRRRGLVYIDADEPRSSAQEAPQPARLDFETARQKAAEIIKAAATEHVASRVSKPVRFGYVRTSLKPLAESLGNWNWINQYQRMYDAALNEQLKREIEIADQLEEDSAIAFLLMNL